MITPHKTFPLKTFSLRVILPTFLTIILFIAVFFYLLIPTVRNNSMERKKEMIRSLTTAAWSVMERYHEAEKRGELSREEAQHLAVDQIRSMHYGQELKDYFWINDLKPTMISHPYRTELIGKDLSNYVDLDGKKVFREILLAVAETGSGYVSYKWQENDKPGLILPKISFVKEFFPWGWVVGTGIYVEDVEKEIASLVQSGVIIAVAICSINLLILISIIWGGYTTHKREREAVLEVEHMRSSLALSEKMASLGKLSAMVAHEINNPLSGILSYAKLSRRYLENVPVSSDTAETVMNNLSIIAGEAKRCGEIAKNLLQFAKQSQGNVREVQLSDVITLSTKIIEHSVKMKGLELILDLGEGDGTVSCDPGAIQQILVSLIVNAMESSDEGGSIIVRTDYSMTDSALIIVADQGHGIRESDLPLIFDPFFSTKESGSSLGLGLSAVYGIVQQHSGDITVASTVGVGTVFTITLPRKFIEKESGC